MSNNFILLNSDKNDVLIIGPDHLHTIYKSNHRLVPFLMSTLLQRPRCHIDPGLYITLYIDI
uniref:Uncharacterized protein n=1 Tax=Anguilla anguilla TaxID=7936 RepID=A0A0E9T122_ANGAN